MGIDENLIEQMAEDIEVELKKKRLSGTTRRALQMDRLMLMFMRQSLEDRARIKVLEESSWGFWVRNNPKLSIFLLSAYVVVSNFVKAEEVLAKVLNLK